MELYQLRYFLELARERNFTRAASRLHLAQTALSEQIRKLEEELGVRLFDRGRRESLLTAEGEALRLHAEGLLEKADAAKRAVLEVAQLRGGRLAIGAIPSVAATLLARALATFTQAHPEVEVVLLEGTSEAIVEMVETGRTELGIVQLPVNQGHFVSNTLLTEPFRVLLAASHPLASQHPIALQRLSTERFLFYRGRARDVAVAACRSAGFEPKICCESGELETLRALVEAGIGVALLPSLAADHLLKPASPIVSLTLEGRPASREVALLSLRSRGLSAAAQKLSQLLHELTRSNATPRGSTAPPPPQSTSRSPE